MTKKISNFPDRDGLWSLVEDTRQQSRATAPRTGDVENRNGRASAHAPSALGELASWLTGAVRKDPSTPVIEVECRRRSGSFQWVVQHRSRVGRKAVTLNWQTCG